MSQQPVGVAVGLGVVVEPGRAAVARAHHPAELDPDRELIGVHRVKRDGTHVVGPRPAGKGPVWLARQLAQCRQQLPAAAVIFGAVQVAGFRSGVDVVRGRGGSQREHAAVGRGMLGPAPRLAGVVGDEDAVVERAHVHAIGLARIHGKRARSHAGEDGLGRPARGVEVEADNIVIGGSEDSGHAGSVLLRGSRSPGTIGPKTAQRQREG